MAQRHRTQYPNCGNGLHMIPVAGRNSAAALHSGAADEPLCNSLRAAYTARFLRAKRRMPQLRLSFARNALTSNQSWTADCGLYPCFF
jgi:hypothetical protein